MKKGLFNNNDFSSLVTATLQASPMCNFGQHQDLDEYQDMITDEEVNSYEGIQSTEIIEDQDMMIRLIHEQLGGTQDPIHMMNQLGGIKEWQKNLDLTRTEPEKRFTIWNWNERRKISGNAAPMGKNLICYLQKHPECQVFTSQDKQSQANQSNNNFSKLNMNQQYNFPISETLKGNNNNNNNNNSNSNSSNSNLDKTQYGTSLSSQIYTFGFGEENDDTNRVNHRQQQVGQVSQGNNNNNNNRTVGSLSSSLDTPEKRITIWHKIEKRKISGNAAPMEKNLEAYLKSHPDCEVFNGQDKKQNNTSSSSSSSLSSTIFSSGGGHGLMLPIVPNNNSNTINNNNSTTTGTTANSTLSLSSANIPVPVPIPKADNEEEEEFFTTNITPVKSLDYIFEDHTTTVPFTPQLSSCFHHPQLMGISPVSSIGSLASINAMELSSSLGHSFNDRIKHHQHFGTSSHLTFEGSFARGKDIEIESDKEDCRKHSNTTDDFCILGALEGV